MRVSTAAVGPLSCAARLVYAVASSNLRVNENPQVERRYSQFDALRERLELEGQVVTSFPCKHLLRSNTKSVVKERVLGFTAFLVDVVLIQTDSLVGGGGSAVSEFLELDKNLQRSTPVSPKLAVQLDSSFSLASSSSAAAATPASAAAALSASSAEHQQFEQDESELQEPSHQDDEFEDCDTGLDPSVPFTLLQACNNCLIVAR